MRHIIAIFGFVILFALTAARWAPTRHENPDNEFSDIREARGYFRYPIRDRRSSQRRTNEEMYELLQDLINLAGNQKARRL